MNTRDPEVDLTAYALNDPGLTAVERAVIETRLAADPAARQFVEDTRAFGQLLTKSLATEPMPAGTPTTAKAVASTLQRKSPFKAIAITIASLAAAMMVGVVGYVEFGKPNGRQQFTTVATAVKPASSDGGPAAEFGDVARAEGTVVRNARPNRAAPAPDAAPDPKSARGQSLDTLTAAAPLPTTLAPLSVPAKPGLPPASGAAPAGMGGPGFGGGFQGGGGYGGAMPGGGSMPSQGVTGPTAKPGPGAHPAPQPAAPVVALPALAGEPSQPRGDVGELEKRAKPADGLNDGYNYERKPDPRGGDQFRQLVENPFIRPEGVNALSTFGVDVDTASYAIVRNMLNRNTIPHPDAVRLEEMVNYFPYRDAPPEGKDPFTVRVEMAECPWQPKHRLVRLALKAKPIDNAKRPPSNLVFLIDVSGSMNEPNKLPLVKASLKLLLDQLGENDRVAIVVYAGASGVVLDSTNAMKKDAIAQALDNLTPGGSTNGGSGIHLAYEQAVKNFIEKGTNRIILCTDGDWNVGTTGTPQLISLIEEKRKTGVFLSVFGFGMGNLRDEMMVQLAGKGNGNYGYIDTIMEAKKALVEQISGTLVTVAKDVKIQIEFNPAKVAAYRLLGYEKRKLAAEDFHNDKKDAGEMGAGHVVTALYELVPVGTALGGDKPKVDGLRYQPVAPAPEPVKPAANDKVAQEAFVVKLRHKLPDADTSTLREIPVSDGAIAYNKASEDFQFASSVAAFAMLLKNSPYKGQATFALVEELAAASLTKDPGAYRAEFLQLVKKAKAITGQP